MVNNALLNTTRRYYCIRAAVVGPTARVIENLRRVFSAHKTATALQIQQHHHNINITQYKHSGRQFVCSLFFDLFSLSLRNTIRVCTRSTYILPYYRSNIGRRVRASFYTYCVLIQVGYGYVANNYALQDKYCAFIVVFCFGFFPPVYHTSHIAADYCSIALLRPRNIFFTVTQYIGIFNYLLYPILYYI